MAPIVVGDIVPNHGLSICNKDSPTGYECLPFHDLAAGKKVVLFSDGGFGIPTCRLKLVSEFLERSEELKAKGVDEIFCITVDNVLDVKEWTETLPENRLVKFMADGSATFVRALGFAFEFSDTRVGFWARRFALFVEDLKVKVANVESGGHLSYSGDQIFLSGGKFSFSVEKFIGEIVKVSGEGQPYEGRQGAQEGSRTRAHQADMLRSRKKLRVGESCDPERSRDKSRASDSLELSPLSESDSEDCLNLSWSCMNALLGPRGSNMERIIQRTGVKVTIKASIASSDEMSVLINGKTSEVLLARNLIQELIAGTSSR